MKHSVRLSSDEITFLVKCVYAAMKKCKLSAHEKQMCRPLLDRLEELEG